MAITIDENVRLLIEAWKLLVGRLPGGVNTQADGVATMCANVALPFFNLSTPERRAADGAELKELLEVAKGRAAACDHTSLLVLTEDWVPEDWEALTGEYGLGMMMNLTGMTAEAVMREAIGHAGGGRITLHASDAGQPLYRAMGFEPGGRMMILGPAH